MTLADGPDLRGKRVLVVEDGPTLTHGGMAFGAGYVAARAAGGDVVEILPAMGYGDEQLRELAERIDATDCDVVVTGTPIDLGRLVDVRHPIRHATYELEEVGSPTLEDVLAPVIELAAKR